MPVTHRAGAHSRPAPRLHLRANHTAVAEVFALSNARGLSARITNYGGIIMSLLAPDRDGRLANVVLGFETPDEYADNPRYLGAIVGRYANRIARAEFTLDGRTYRLAANNGVNHLHGGVTGFDRRVWRPALSVAKGAACSAGSLELRYLSPDGEEGYPGNLDVRVTYTLTDRDELVVEYVATTDQPTPLNLTQHSYFNLGGDGEIRDHLLQIDADAYTPVNEQMIPTGALAPVAGTAFDFRSPMTIGARRGGNYDHNFVLKGGIRVVEPRSGRTLDVQTTEPGMQLYTGYSRGLCLETQHFPDSPNQPSFPSTILRPGTEYRSRTVFAFGILK
ncbi:MAG TPA: aldose epimerase family protein [Gemmatimonadales bacterium]|nr:aldose epimerase family protein [Gemmatimonadales bacterium]